MKKGKLSAVLALGLAIVMLAGMLSLPVSAVEGSRAPITSETQRARLPLTA